jgi:hypothetical protein
MKIQQTFAYFIWALSTYNVYLKYQIRSLMLVRRSKRKLEKKSKILKFYWKQQSISSNFEQTCAVRPISSKVVSHFAKSPLWNFWKIVTDKSMMKLKDLLREQMTVNEAIW